MGNSYNFLIVSSHSFPSCGHAGVSQCATGPLHGAHVHHLPLHQGPQHPKTPSRCYWPQGSPHGELTEINYPVRMCDFDTGMCFYIMIHMHLPDIGFMGNHTLSHNTESLRDCGLSAHSVENNLTMI